MNKYRQIAFRAWEDISKTFQHFGKVSHDDGIRIIESAIEKAVAHLQLQIIALHDELERAARATESETVTVSRQLFSDMQRELTQLREDRAKK